MNCCRYLICQVTSIKIRMAIYDNSGSYLPGPVPTNHGIPYNVLGQGEIDISGTASFRFKIY